MSLRRDDGRSIAVWENSPWRAFIRQRDPADAESQAGNGSQQFRNGQDISQLLYQNNTDDIREIFGRALDATRSNWSYGHAKWNRSGDASSYGLDDDFFDDDDEESTTDTEKAESQPQQTETLPASPVVRNGSIRIAAPSSRRRRGTATGSCASAEDSDVQQHGGGPEWTASAPRTPARMHILSPGGGSSISDPNSQLVCVTRSPQGAQPGSPISPFADAGSRSGRARAVTLGGGGGVSATMSSKLLHVQAASMPARHSLEMNSSRKVMSPTGPNVSGSLRRSNSFDEGRHGGEAATSPSASRSTAAVVAAHERSQGNPRVIRNHRAATTTGTVPVVASSCSSFQYRTSGGGGSSSGGVEPHASLQRDVTLMRSRSRRTGLHGGDDRWASGSDGGHPKNPSLGPSSSSRMMEVHGARSYTTPHLTKVASSVATSAAVAAAAALVTPLASGSYCQLIQTPSGDVRKHPVSTVLAAHDSGRSLGGHSAGHPGENGRSILGGENGPSAVDCLPSHLLTYLTDIIHTHITSGMLNALFGGPSR
ncbi:hypothetical protein VOLCADRAFT_88186 [Volvox carteri f. nagariensis]|uniref:Uncharacterized protein n=1 Tax=Volvox carteri f. nagariensis TaxID=3068 RepID=D8TNI1_VOLCA|nr:uncharacterized protein VOLCADRAFT_88186 [Volvox carteri f. nagariensis]EFJ50998.1 hypothetical protein VOLCADRAFT_88186 [Volvox carteri f. nagariensis]|eukprot:XP_002948010.1 hypothetical protein VOLCADRAFT_88186 [Volvox carteri f. nagariensis]